MKILCIMQIDNRYNNVLSSNRNQQFNIKKIFDLVLELESVTDIVINTYRCPENLEFEKLIEKHEEITIKYSEKQNLSERFIECIENYDVDIVMRIRGDQEEIDIQVMNDIITKFVQTKSDFYYPFDKNNTECDLVRKDIVLKNREIVCLEDRYYKVFLNGKINCKIMKENSTEEKRLSFNDIYKLEYIHLYAGDIPINSPQYSKCIGLSINKGDERHINHDITTRHELPDDIVDIYQSEDVFEHIEREHIVRIVNDIYRILKPKTGVFRLSVPDYRCDVFYERCKKDEKGNILFDPIGGGEFINGKVVEGGHIWFPKYELVKEILDKSLFKRYQFLHYHDENYNSITNPINYDIGYIQRTPDNDDRMKKPYRAGNIVVDCYKD